METSEWIQRFPLRASAIPSARICGSLRFDRIPGMDVRQVAPPAQLESCGDAGGLVEV